MAAPVRAAALGALARLGQLRPEELQRALSDPDPVVRRRACDVAPKAPEAQPLGLLVELLSDNSVLVVEAACWALGELGGAGLGDAGPQTRPREVVLGVVVRALCHTATSHADPLCREAAVAALGSLGHPSALAAVLSALSDKPAVRWRAVIALAAFEGPEVEAALSRATRDPDWQVRQAAEDLLG